MADSTTTAGRRQVVLLAGSWTFVAVMAIVFAWLTTDVYVRQMLQPLPGEAPIAVTDCTADPTCPRDGTDQVRHQVALLERTAMLTHISAWSVIVLAVLMLAILTALAVRRQHRRAAGVAAMAWKAQAAWTVLVLLLHLVLLSTGSRALTHTPEPSRMFTFTKAFDTPYTDVGHLYYLAWLTATAVSTSVLTYALTRRWGRPDHRENDLP